jgi:hypothetical protein
LIGDCKLSLSTFVSQDSESSSKVKTPAASVVAGTLAGVLAAAVVLTIACCCCAKKRKTAAAKQDPNVDKVMDFRRMVDDSNTPSYTDPSVRMT